MVPRDFSLHLLVPQKASEVEFQRWITQREAAGDVSFSVKTGGGGGSSTVVPPHADAIEHVPVAVSGGVTAQPGSVLQAA